MKVPVWLAQPNYEYGENVFIPYSAGRLWAYAKTIPEIDENYHLGGFIFKREPTSQVLDRMRPWTLPNEHGHYPTRLMPPAVLALSCYIWNWEYNKALAQAVRARFKECLIVMGGPQVPDNSQGFFQEHPYVDLLVHGEGELAFAEILSTYTKVEDKFGLYRRLCLKPGYSYPDGDKTVKTGPSNRSTNLDQLPSPYLTGVFDELIENKNHKWQALQETNRGCPYMCTFCLARGSTIETLHGKKTIEDIVEGDFVLGADDRGGAPAWAEVTRSKLTGARVVRELITESGARLSSTPDHLIYTQAGWKQAQDIKVGERVAVLQSLWRSANQEEPSRLFPGVQQSGYITADYSAAQARTDAKDSCIGGIEAAMFDSHEKEQPHEEEGSCRASEQDVERNLCARRNQTTMAINPGASSQIVCQNEEQQPYARTGNPRSHMEVDIQACKPDQTGEASTGVRGETQPAVQVHRESNLLDWPMSVGLGEEPGFRAYGRSQESNLSSWDVLAYESASLRQGAVRGLQTDGMAGADYLGLGKAGPGALGKNQAVPIAWERVTAVVDGKSDYVYDITVPATGNFFAEGILVHNCDWGSATFAKVTKFPVDPIKKEIDWFADKQIELLYNCDANFGMLEQDTAIAQALVESKQRTGFPQKFRAAYAKKITDRVFNVAKVLADAGMSKGATISFQSLNRETLDTVKRLNPVQSSLRETFDRYNSNSIPTYTELILGLPGESYDSFRNGINELLSAGQHHGLNIYPCMALKNSEMSKPEYVAEHGLKTIRVPMLLLHGIPPGPDEVQEQYDLIIETATMPHADWRRGYLLGWIVQALHCSGLTDSIAIKANELGVSFVDFYEGLLEWAQDPRTVLGKQLLKVEWMLDDVIKRGKQWPVVDTRFGPIAWPPEELAYLNIVQSIPRFFIDIRRYLESKNLVRDGMVKITLDQADSVPDPEVFDGTLEDFAREVVWYGRKGGIKSTKRANDEQSNQAAAV